MTSRPRCSPSRCSSRARRPRRCCSTAAAEHAGRSLSTEAASVLRFIGDERAVVIGVWREGGNRGLPVNAELDFDHRNSALGRVRLTRRPARADSYEGMRGELPAGDARDRPPVDGRRPGDGRQRGVGSAGGVDHPRPAAAGGQRAPDQRLRRADRPRRRQRRCPAPDRRGRRHVAAAARARPARGHAAAPAGADAHAPGRPRPCGCGVRARTSAPKRAGGGGGGERLAQRARARDLSHRAQRARAGGCAAGARRARRRAGPHARAPQAPFPGVDGDHRLLRRRRRADRRLRADRGRRRPRRLARRGGPRRRVRGCRPAAGPRRPRRRRRRPVPIDSADEGGLVVRAELPIER